MCASWRRLYVTWWCATAAESGNCEWCRLRLRWPSGGADCVTSLYLRVAEHSVWFSSVPENKRLGFLVRDWTNMDPFLYFSPISVCIISSSSTWCGLIVTVTVKVKCQLLTCDFCRVINITFKVTWRSLSLCFNGHVYRWTWLIQYQNVSILDFIGAKDDGDGYTLYCLFNHL